MGKGKRNRRERDRQPPRASRSVADMAPDMPMPVLHPELPEGHPKQHRYWGRVLYQQLHGVMLLLNYVAFVADGGFDVPAENFGPQRDDEADDQFQLRRTAVLKLKEVQAAAGTWAELATDEIRHIRPSDAGGAAMLMIDQGHEWCQESRFDPTANTYREVATPLLHAMCPAEYLDRALEVLDMFWNEIVFHRAPSIEETAVRYPIATLHVTAAMTAGLFGIPACVPDQALTQAKLVEVNKKLVTALFPDPRR